MPRHSFVPDAMSGGTKTNRLRIVAGSCWPCKKRRVKCDLEKPICRRCGSHGAICDYNTRLIRWKEQPTTNAQTTFQTIPPFSRHDSPLGSRERLALDYFHSRVWPLLSTAPEPCPSPIPVALEHRAVLLTTCLLADSHRLLQDGRGSVDDLHDQRMQCLAAVRSDVGQCCTITTKRDSSLLILLFAVLFLYIDDGFMECMRRSASTWSHHAGVLAILNGMGGMEAMLESGPEALQMLLSEFASADLTTAVLQGKCPAFPPSTWDTIDEGAVWWGRDALKRCSLASTFKRMAEIAFYMAALTNTTEILSMARIREFEIALQPVYASVSVQDLDLADTPHETASSTASIATSEPELEYLQVFTLIRAFQHSTLIYLYRALCGLSASHPLVQQHVQSCLDAIFEIPPDAHVLNCVIFPLCIAGAHAERERQRAAVLELVNRIHENMKFAAVQSVRLLFDELWNDEDARSKTWIETFAQLGPHALIL